MLPGKKFTAQDAAAIARRRWALVLVPVVVCSFGALVVSAYLPNVYGSEMLIEIVPQRVPDSYVRSTVTMRIEDRIGALRDQIRSRSQLEPLIQELNLYSDDRHRLPMQDVVDRMRAAIDVQLVRRRGEPVNSFTVSFRYSDPVMVARVTDRLGRLLVDQNTHERGRIAAGTSNFLQDQLKEALAKLEAQDVKLKEFRERHAGRLPTQVGFNQQAMQGTQAQIQSLVDSIQRARDRRLMLEASYKSLEALPLAVSPVIAAVPSAQAGSTAVLSGSSARQQLELARAQLADLQRRYKADHPDVRRKQREIAELVKKAAAESAPESKTPAEQPPAIASLEELSRRDRLNQTRAEIESLNRQIPFQEAEEQRLRKVLADYQARIEAVPGLESEWMKLTRDYDTLQEQYKDLLAKSQQSKVSLELELAQIGEQFRVLDHATVPAGPISPIRLQINGIGFGVGLLIGLVVVASLEVRDSSFRTEADVLDVLALPVLALVPYVESRDDLDRERRRRLWLSGAVGVAVLAGSYVFWTLELWKHIV